MSRWREHLQAQLNGSFSVPIIGSIDGVNLGLATALFLPFVGGVFALDPRCCRMMFDPDHRNVAARRVCEALGCEFLGEYDMANRRMALYAFARPATA